AEQPAAVLLLRERRVELGAGEETLLDHQLAETARRRRRSGCLRYRFDVVVQQARCGALRRRLGLRLGLHPLFLMPELDRPPQARAESLLLLELELALGREHADERRRRDESAGEEDLAELLPRPARLLLGERGCELVFGDELVRQEELTQAGAAR